MFFLSVISIIENMMGVYRNFSALSKNKKKIVKTGVVIASIVLMVTSFDFCYYMYKTLLKINVVSYLFITLFNVLFSTMMILKIITSVWKSVKFNKLLVLLRRIHDICENESFSRSIKKLNIQCTVILAIIVVTSIIQLASDFKDANFNIYGSPYTIAMFILQKTLVCWKIAMFVMENLLFYYLTKVINVMLKNTNGKIISLLGCFDEKNCDNEEVYVDCDIEKYIREISVVYNYLISCCNKMRRCFGIQVCN